jgi:hypothetical protein
MTSRLLRAAIGAAYFLGVGSTTLFAQGSPIEENANYSAVGGSSASLTANVNAVGDLVVFTAWCDSSTGGCTPTSVVMGSQTATKTSVSGVADNGSVDSNGGPGSGQGFIYYILSASASGNQTVTFTTSNATQTQVSYIDFAPSSGYHFTHHTDSTLGSCLTNCGPTTSSGAIAGPSFTPTTGDLVFNFTYTSEHINSLGTPWSCATYNGPGESGTCEFVTTINAAAYIPSASSGAIQNNMTDIHASDTWQAMFASFAQVANGNIYYVSKSTGSDSNTSTQAKSKSTPWAHLRGMASATGNAATYTPAAGDTFILMGCDTWVPSDFPVLWDWSGTSANPITITVDKTWYNTTVCSSGWNRPIWDGQNTLTNEFIRASADNATSYVTLDNIEMKRSAAFNNILSYNPTYGWIMSNLYIHAWDQATDNCRVVQFEAGSPAINLFTNGIIDGADSTGAAALHACYAFYPTPPSITNSVIHDLVNPIVGYAGGGSGGSVVTIAGNNIYNVNTSYQGFNHGNAIEIVGSGTYYIYNNLIHHMVCPGCESMMIGNSGETSYIWNNVIWDLGALGSQAQTPSIPQNSASGFTERFWNNTIVATDNQSCVNASGQSASSYTVTVQNTHCIQGSAGVVTDYTAVSPNLEQTAAQASANSSPHFDQYMASEAFAYSPLASTNSTVGVGANLTSTAAGAIASLSSDTTYSCTEKTVGSVVQSVCLGISNARPLSGAWDVGAYQFSTSTAQALQPPTKLQAAVQ